jgi:CRISPR-associated protein Csm3
MFKQLANEARIRFAIQTQGPLLIRQGDETSLDPTRPDMQFVRTTHPSLGTETVYIPGSSLKGVFRSRSEQVLRGVLSGTGIHVCSLFGDDACGRNSKLKQAGGAERYAAHCPVCRLYGSLLLGGRAAFSDAFPDPTSPVRLGQRNHVALNRISGGPQRRALFSPEVVESARFQAEIRLTNYATWQLVLVALVLDDLNQGFVGLGGGTTRGYGRVTIPSVQVEVRDYRKEPGCVLQGYRAHDQLDVPVAFQRRGLTYAGSLPFDTLLQAAAELDFAAAIARDREGEPGA